MLCYVNAKQKHLGCKKVQSQSEATLQTGMCDQKLWYQLRPRSYFTKTICNSLTEFIAYFHKYDWLCHLATFYNI